MKPMTLFWALPILVLIMGAESCATKREIKQESKNTAAFSKPKIAFLTYGVSLKHDGELAIKLLDKILVQGVLKKEDFDLKSSRHGDLVCIILDENENSQNAQFIANPLKKSVEYVNFSGEFERKEVISDNGQFSVRLQLLENSKYAVIKQVDTLTNQDRILFTSELD